MSRSIVALVMSCEERQPTLQATLARLAACGWPSEPEVVLDDGVGQSRLKRIQLTWRRLVRRAADARSELVLMLEDDVVFGNWFCENLRSWELLRQLPQGQALFASLYNPNHPFRFRRARERYQVADPRYAWGSQAVVTTPRTARYIDQHWDEVEGNPDQRMPLIAGQVTPIYYHVPSLVNHASVPTTWGGMVHSAVDFDPDWRAATAANASPVR